MRKLLLIDCCIRKELSQTKRLMEAFLHAVPADCAVERLVLTEENLAPLMGDFFAQRQRLLKAAIMRTRVSDMPSSLRRRTLL